MHHAFLYISYPLLHDCDMKLPNFTRLFYGVDKPNRKILNTFLSDSTPENFANIWQIKWNWIRSNKFETVRIHFVSEFSVCCHLDILLPWKRDVTTSSLHPTQFFQYILRNFFLEENQFSITCHLKIQHLFPRKFINEHKE